MKISLTKLLAETGQTVSMSEGRRCIVLGAVKLNGEVVTDLTAEVEVKEGDTIQVSKRSIVTLTTELLERING